MTTIKPSLRFGVMCNGTNFPLWQARCLQALLETEGVEPALLIEDVKPPVPGSSPWKKMKTLLKFKLNFFSIYNRYSVQRRARASVPVDMSSSLRQVPRVRSEVIKKGKFSEYFKPEDLDAIRSYNLDFILRFAFNIIRGEILTLPGYGVWSFHHGDEQKYRGAPPCFWEIYRDEPSTGAILQRLTERLDGGVVLKKGVFSTIFHSYPRNRDTAHFLGTNWPADVCRDIREGSADYLAASPTTTTAPLCFLPTNRQMLVFGLKQICHQTTRPLSWLRPARRGNVGDCRD